jgi:hypothetical protein
MARHAIEEGVADRKTRRLTTSLPRLAQRLFMQRRPGALFTRVGALQKDVALLKPLAIRLRNADRLARVSTSEQETTVQVTALRAVRCERIYREKASGGRSQAAGIGEVVGPSRPFNSRPR